MSDEETRERRKKNLTLRNKHAKELRENSGFRIRRVEDKKKIHKRYKSNEIINNLDKFIEDDIDD